MALTTNENTQVILGSGDLFLGTVANVETATETEIEAALSHVGAISGGASLQYSPTFTDVKGGRNNGVVASFLTSEEVTFTSGILHFDLDNLGKINPAVVTTDVATNTRRLGLGGVNALNINYLRFIHTKPSGKKLTVNIFKAKNTNGFTLTFDPSKETIIDAQFKALATGKTNGNLVEIIEELEA